MMLFLNIFFFLGPFTCTEMAEWFQSGYFTLNLLVRRACDPNYAPLGDLIKLWGCIPFLPELHPLVSFITENCNNIKFYVITISFDCLIYIYIILNS